MAAGAAAPQNMDGGRDEPGPGAVKLILGTGVDLVEVRRLAAAVERRGQRFLERVFTARELAEARGGAARYQSLAGRFAAKEAVLKALGTGLRACRWRDVEVARGPGGRPEVALRGSLARRARAAGVERVHLSIAHTREHAVALAVAEGRPAPREA